MFLQPLHLILRIQLLLYARPPPLPLQAFSAVADTNPLTALFNSLTAVTNYTVYPGLLNLGDRPINGSSDSAIFPLPEKCHFV